MRVVLDSSVVVAAIRSRHGASNALLRFVAKGRIHLLVSPPLFLEYEDVLLRPEQVEAHGWSKELIERFLRALAQRLEPVEIRFHWRPQLPDPADDMVLETAVNGRVDALITHNIRHFKALEKVFGIEVLTPGQFIRRLEHE